MSWAVSVDVLGRFGCLAADDVARWRYVAVLMYSAERRFVLVVRLVGILKRKK